jgi:hypothetical protein
VAAFHPGDRTAIDAIPHQPRILYVGGWGRSGSTLVARMVGQLPGFASVGEVREIWIRGLQENAPCGCDQPFRACPFWREVGEQAFGGWGAIDAKQWAAMRYRFDRPWCIPLFLAPSTWREGSAELRRYVWGLGRLYRAISEVSRAEVIVDSSKLPSFAWLLRTVPGLELRMLHLVRDSRGVAFSWRKQVLKDAKADPTRYLSRYRPTSAAARWLLYNGLTRSVRRAGVPYLLARYEDFVAAPEDFLPRIAGMAGTRPSEGDLRFLSDGRVALNPDHTVDGNPMRFAVGDVILRPDQSWRRNMPFADRVLVTALTAPGLLRYGYSLGAGRSRT